MAETEASKKLAHLRNDAATKLTKAWGPVYRFLTFSLANELISPKRFLSISIEKGQISFAYGIRLLSRIKIKDARKYTIENGRYPQPGELISFLTLFINESGASRSDITLSIPKTWTVIRTVDLPISVKENLSGAISYEMDRLTPFASEDAFFDFKVLKEDAERINLLLMAVRTELVRPYINVLNENGFGLERITINLSAMGTLCHYMGEDISEFIFLEIDSHGYECGLFIDGLMTQAYSDELVGIEDVEKSKKISSDVISLVETAKAMGRSPQIMTLFKDEMTIKDQLRSAMGMPLKMIDEAKPNIPNYHEKGSYTAVGGLIQSLWQDEKAPNLLRKGITEKERPPYTLTIILLLALIVTFIFYIIAPLSVEGKRLKEISHQIALKEEKVKRVEAIKKEVEILSSEISTINDFKGSVVLTLDILKELTSILPNDAWLTGLKLKGNTLEINGYATSATGLLPILDASAYFDKVEFASPTVRDRILKSDRFRIKMQIVRKGQQGGTINAEE